ncbi:hypothetical protein EYF80_010712 [Liparis tanakae]|uniref:Uncharacterized protein n=1 Tax=Liparis tanakae TaxID=230148 RepID=A0A4Z2IPD1_9TELE|nr:hypothetical protein EYF80_010712 [Liparis tanakae]
MSDSIQQAIGDGPAARPFLIGLASGTRGASAAAGPLESLKDAIAGGMRLSSSCLWPVSRSHSWNLTSTNSWNWRFCSLERTRTHTHTHETSVRTDVKYGAGREYSAKILQRGSGSIFSSPFFSSHETASCDEPSQRRLIRRRQSPRHLARVALRPERHDQLVKLGRGQQAVAGGVRAGRRVERGVGEALVPQEQRSIPGVGDHSQPHAGHVILQGRVDGVEGPQRDVHVSGEEQGAGGRQGVDGQFLAGAQAGGYPKGVEREALVETGEELVQGEGVAEGGVAGPYLEQTFGEQLVDGLNLSAGAEGTLQEQAQAPHSLQGYLAKNTHETNVRRGRRSCRFGL